MIRECEMNVVSAMNKPSSWRNKEVEKVAGVGQ